MLEALTSALIEVVDHLIALVREGKGTRRELFDNHIDPIFNMLEVIIADYLALFTELDKEFQDTTVAPSQTIEKIIIRRRTTASLREKTKRYADAIYDAFEDENIHRFALACRNLLHSEPSYLASKGGGMASTLIGMLSEIGRAASMYHGIDIEIDAHGIEAFTRVKGDTDGRAVIDSTPRELFSLIVRAHQKGVELAWSSAARTYYRLKLSLLR
jgi:hypothetical protein